MKRAIVLCPGRGSYAKDSLGYLHNIQSERLDQCDRFRENLGRKTVREMDSLPRFQAKWHVCGENASVLTAGISGADYDQISDSYNVVGICGNSMGWYTALGLSNALPYGESLRLIETMGQYQEKNVIGGQIIYPLVDEHWRPAPQNQNIVEEIISQTADLHWSIKLGGQAVLGGSNAALERALSALPSVTLGRTEYPFRLPMHSAFHTPLMSPTHRQALQDLSDLPLHTPSVPLIDGRGYVWRPRACSSQDLLDYTLNEQVVQSYDFTAMIRTVLRQFAPEVIILLGPGSNLGGSVAQVLIQQRWDGISSKQDFLQRQKDNPIVLAMARPEQRKLVVQ